MIGRRDEDIEGNFAQQQKLPLSRMRESERVVSILSKISIVRRVTCCRYFNENSARRTSMLRNHSRVNSRVSRSLLPRWWREFAKGCYARYTPPRVAILVRSGRSRCPWHFDATSQAENGVRRAPVPGSYELLNCFVTVRSDLLATPTSSVSSLSLLLLLLCRGGLSRPIISGIAPRLRPLDNLDREILMFA